MVCIDIPKKNIGRESEGEQTLVNFADIVAIRPLETHQKPDRT